MWLSLLNVMDYIGFPLFLKKPSISFMSTYILKHMAIVHSLSILYSICEASILHDNGKLLSERVVPIKLLPA